MISIISCSVNPERLEKFKSNISHTIGVPFEIIDFDNREHGYGLSKVYNLCAERAKYNYLCFIHEDIKFNTENWGKIIIKQLAKNDTGLIGFAGSTAKMKALSGWSSNSEYTRYHFIQHFRNNEIQVLNINPKSENYSPVIVLDGFCLFTRKNVWNEFKFDESTFEGFHLYDLDFSLQIVQKYKNFVCNVIEIEHFSEGAYNESWIEDTIKLHKKWEPKLPMYLNYPSDTKQRSNEIKMSRKFIKILLKKKACSKDVLHLYYKEHCKKYPFHYSLILLLFDYYKYKIRLKTSRKL